MLQVQLRVVSSVSGRIFLHSAPQRTLNPRGPAFAVFLPRTLPAILLSVVGEGHPVEVKMQMKVLWSTLLLLAATPSVLSQSGTAPLVSSVAAALIVLTSGIHSCLLS